MDKKGKGYDGQGEAKNYSAQQPVAKPRVPYAKGLSSTTIIFEKLGKLEEITRIEGKDKITLKIDFGGFNVLIDYRGKIPKKCQGHSVYVYEEVRAGRSKRIQIWDQTEGKHYYGSFR